VDHVHNTTDLLV